MRGWWKSWKTCRPAYIHVVKEEEKVGGAGSGERGGGYPAAQEGGDGKTDMYRYTIRNGGMGGLYSISCMAVVL